ncbi:MFS transporter [Phenylobacterium sp.]|uniref:MFS transporter n=1 Tax=Phenylobacterium sp. TaxID=1871053 RepID=UPI00260F988A|nr:MFS transporter [Phenylobacterium sp.]
MTAKPAAAPERLNFRTKFLYGFGSLSYGVHLTVLPLLLFFYNQVVGLSAQVVSAALAVSLIVDAVWDPMVGHISDNLRTRWGRRHPFLYGSAIPIAVSWVLLWSPPGGFSMPQKALWLLVFVVGARLLISLYEMPASALAPELAPDYHDRTVVMSYRWVLGTLGGALAANLGYFWFFRPTPKYPMGQLNPDAWGPMAVTAAGIMLASILVSAIGTHGHIPRLHRPAQRRASLLQNLREIAATLKNWNLGVALTGTLLGGLASGLYTGLALYIDTFFWGLRASQVGVLSITNLVASFAAAVVAAAYSRRVGKRRACVSLFFASLVVLQAPLLLRLLGAFPGPGEAALMPLLMLQRFAWGILGNAGFIVVTSMIADITEDAQVKTGRRSEGLVMSTNTFIGKATAAASALMPGLVLAFVHFPAKARPGAVDPGLIRHLVWVYLPVTTTLSFLSISAWLLYRIDQAAHERNLATVREAEAVAEAAREAGAEGEAPTPLRAVV